MSFFCYYYSLSYCVRHILFSKYYWNRINWNGLNLFCIKFAGIPIVMPKFMKRANESASSCSGSQREPEGTGSVQREPCSNALAERSTNSQSNKFIENMVPQKSVVSFPLFCLPTY